MDFFNVYFKSYLWLFQISVIIKPCKVFLTSHLRDVFIQQCIFLAISFSRNFSYEIYCESYQTISLMSLFALLLLLIILFLCLILLIYLISVIFVFWETTSRNASGMFHLCFGENLDNNLGTYVLLEILTRVSYVKDKLHTCYTNQVRLFKIYL